MTSRRVFLSLVAFAGAAVAATRPAKTHHKPGHRSATTTTTTLLPAGDVDADLYANAY